MAQVHTQGLRFRRTLTGVLVRPDGTRIDLGVLASSGPGRYQWKRNLRYLLGSGLLLSLALSKDPLAIWLLGMVTTAGGNYMAQDFLAGSAARINAFNWHDTGSGFVAEAVTDVALGLPTGMARVAGTQSNPSSCIYRTVATLLYDAPYTITEWGLFSAAAASILWDRAVLAVPRPVATAESIEYTYDLSVVVGG